MRQHLNSHQRDDRLNTPDPVPTPADIAEIKNRWALALFALTLSIATLVAAGTTLAVWMPHDSQKIEELR